MGKKKYFLCLLSAIGFTLAAVLSACVAGGHNHRLSFVPSAQETCVQDGNRAHYACDICGRVFWDEAGERETTLRSVTLAATGHDLSKAEGRAATYTRPGLSEGEVCRKCGFWSKEQTQTAPPTTSFVQKTYEKDGYTLGYCLYTPKDLLSSGDKAPLILFLHGAGERGNDNESQLRNAILRVYERGEWAKSVIIAPQCPAPREGTESEETRSASWVETVFENGNYRLADVPESEPLKYAAELVKEYATYEYIDADRIYVVGLSMGGFGTWDVLSRHPELFAAGVPVSGGGPTDAVDVLKNIPVYTFHGNLDNIVPYAGTREMYELITESGGERIVFHTFPLDHVIWNRAIVFEGDEEHPALEDWLFAQRKSERL